MVSNQNSGVINVAVTAARAAGTVISRSIDDLEKIEVNQKGLHDVVSEIDLMAEREIIEVIHNNYPSNRIQSEEREQEINPAPDSKPQDETDYLWIIDPLDGTLNFIHGHPYCAVSIAVQVDGETRHAVIYDPFRNELFTASKGSGAHLDGRRIRVSKNTKLSDSLVVTGFPYREAKDTKPWLKSFAAALPRVQSIHRTGASTLDLAYLACGRYDGFWEMGLKKWDIAAGALIVREAGGLVTDLTGSTDEFATGDLVAGTPHVHEKLLHIIKNTV